MDYPAARRTLLRLKKHVPRLLELLSTMPDSRRLSETWLETADVALGGKPDLIAISPDNLALVIDYKSGLVSDDEGVKSAYVRQLLFYGVLVDECSTGDPGDAGSAVPARGSGAGRAVRRGNGRGS